MERTVSILIPCYNAQQWIGQAINSALGQSYPHVEVIVVDDGSTDDSVAVIQSFDGLIRWETQSNQGGNPTRNRLLDLSTGEWIQYLDSDDYLLPNKIEKQLEILEQVPEADVIYSPSIFEYWNDNSSRQEVLAIPKPHDPWVLLARWYLPQTGSPLWRKSAITDVGRWKPEQPCCQEHELYLRLLMDSKKFIYCDYAGSVYRQWSEGTVCRKDIRQVYTQRLIIEDHMEKHLLLTNQLTKERQHAINQARFECARKIWLFDQNWAKQIMKQVNLSKPSFQPSGTAAPKSYQLTYRLLGFELSEQIANYKRKLSSLFRTNIGST
jgi:glycosyltransferase involved in cell wall biosynthesis